MSAAVYRDEPGKLASGVMAVAVHVAFFVLLLFGVSWQHRPPERAVVELWNNLPPAPVTKVIEPEPKPEIKPPPPPPVEAKPIPKLEPKPVPEPKPVAKPDIAIEKEKQEKARREREQREKDEAKKREDIAKAEARKKEDAEKRQLAALEAERAAKEAERVRLDKEKAAIAQQAQQQEAAARTKEIDSYKSKIAEKLKRFVVKDPCAPLGNPEITFEVSLFPDGNTLGDPVIRRSSGSAACDQAVLRAVIRAQPLPLPPADRGLSQEFRNLNLRFKPME